MTRPTLRLVVDRSHEEAPTSIELPSLGVSTLHVHLHLGDMPTGDAVTEPAAEKETAGGQAEKGTLRKILLAGGVCLMALVSYRLGTYADSDRSAVAAPRAMQPSYAYIPANPTYPPSPNQLPSVVREQLAMRPTVTLPPGASAEPNAPSPFGLHP